MRDFFSSHIRKKNTRRARGRTGGGPPKLTPKKITTIRALHKSAEISVAKIAARFHIARSAFYRAILKAAA